MHTSLNEGTLLFISAIESFAHSKMKRKNSEIYEEIKSSEEEYTS